MEYIAKHKLTFIGILLGGIAGYIYYRVVGCATGTCLITSNPFITIIYGAFMGSLFFNIFKSENKKNHV